MSKIIKSKKITSGLYEVTIESGRVFHVEDAYQARGDGEGFRNDWNLFEMTGEDLNDREYCQSYGSKKAAMNSIEDAAKGEW